MIAASRRVSKPGAGVSGVAGVVLPALVYVLIVGLAGSEGLHGWGAVVGTDTAFMLGTLAIVGPRLSGQLRVFLLTLTVVDDFLAVSIIGIVYIVAAAAGILALDSVPHGAENLKSLLVGQILWVTWPTVIRIAAIYAVVAIFHWLLRRRFLTISFREEEARSRGWSLRWWDFLFYATFGFVITISVPIAGVLLVFSFLIVPAVCASLFSERVGVRLGIAWAVGFLVSALGCSLSYIADLPTGATVVCTFGLALLVAAGLRVVRSGAGDLPGGLQKKKCSSPTTVS